MSQKEIIEKIKNNNKLTQREKVTAIIEQTENITVIYHREESKYIMCNKCREYIKAFDSIIDEHLEFECRYCGKNVKVPLYVWDKDVYSFPNEHYTMVPRRKIKAQSLAQAYGILMESL